MTDAPAHRPFYDANSHILESHDFLRDYADPAIREQIPQVSSAASLGVGIAPLEDPNSALIELFEDVGALVDQSVADLSLLSRDQFYAGNFLRIFPDARVH